MAEALICLSGGVDSTAALLRCAGRFSTVRAVFVDVRGKGVPGEAERACCELGAELIVLPGREPFLNRVRTPSEELLQMGLTPNPCAICNAEVKLAMPFGILEPGELLVTGHYASMEDGVLSRGADAGKDQSYFLSLVPSAILNRCFFPLADSIKEEVRREVLDSGLPFIPRESQDLCFQPRAFTEPGEIVDTEGRVLGRHRGLSEYTPGQRKGIGAHGGRKYVVKLDPVLNRVVIGDERDLYSEICMLNSINWLQEEPRGTFECLLQTRYRKKAFPAAVTVTGDGSSARAVFAEPQRSVAPGQVGAMYLNDRVAGGGIISTH